MTYGLQCVRHWCNVITFDYMHWGLIRPLLVTTLYPPWFNVDIGHDPFKYIEMIYTCAFLRNKTRAQARIQKGEGDQKYGGDKYCMFFDVLNMHKHKNQIITYVIQLFLSFFYYDPMFPFLCFLFSFKIPNKGRGRGLQPPYTPPPSEQWINKMIFDTWWNSGDTDHI